MSKVGKERIDVLLVKQGLVESREKAQALILAGKVLSGDRLFSKPSEKVPLDTSLRLRDVKDQYVARSAHKLLHAIDNFKIDLTGKVCLDIGSSTGGFTQVCLEKGAVQVFALDVGTNQLHWSLRNDARVVSLEQINIRDVPGNLLPSDADFICIDTSFISLKLVLPEAKKYLSQTGSLVALIKPQHEVGKDQVGKGGIVTDPLLHEKVQTEIAEFAQSIGLQTLGLIESSIKGSTGNKEFLIHLSKIREFRD